MSLASFSFFTATSNHSQRCQRMCHQSGRPFTGSVERPLRLVHVGKVTAGAGTAGAGAAARWRGSTEGPYSVAQGTSCQLLSLAYAPLSEVYKPRRGYLIILLCRCCAWLQPTRQPDENNSSATSDGSIRALLSTFANFPRSIGRRGEMMKRTPSSGSRRCSPAGDT